MDEKNKEPEQDVLFHKGEPWHEHWRGMPEYVSEDLTPLKSIFVHFETKEDIAAFAELLGQTVTMETKSIWFPEAEIGRIAGKRWVTASPILYKNKRRPK